MTENKFVKFEDTISKSIITLSLSKFALLRQWKDALTEGLNAVIAEKIKDINFSIGGEVFASVTSPYCVIHIRRWRKYSTFGKSYPTNEGIAFKEHEWKRFWDCVITLEINIPSLTEAQPCISQADHANVLGSINCGECNPTPNDN